MSYIPINERSIFLVTKSAKDSTLQATTTKKKKYTVLAEFLSGVGLTDFSVAHYMSSSGGGGGGDGIRASLWILLMVCCCCCCCCCRSCPWTYYVMTLSIHIQHVFQQQVHGVVNCFKLVKPLLKHATTIILHRTRVLVKILLSNEWWCLGRMLPKG